MTELCVSHLEVHYGDLVGVADVSLRVERGTVVALLGSNGSGKTTTLNAIAGLVQPSGSSSGLLTRQVPQCSLRRATWWASRGLTVQSPSRVGSSW